jgi:hypothetical protein
MNNYIITRTRTGELQYVVSTEKDKENTDTYLLGVREEREERARGAPPKKPGYQLPPLGIEPCIRGLIDKISRDM